METKVSITIVSWNVRDLLITCIREFYTKEDIDLIVIDNNSSDDTVHVLRSEFPNVTLIVNKDNLGFARANNQGFRYCKGEYIFILNPDTLTTYDDLKKLIQVLDTRPEVGGVSPKIFYSDGDIQKSCARLLPTLKSYLLLNMLKLYNLPIVGKYLYNRLKYPYRYDCSGYIEACSGAAYLIRRTLLETIGGFNEDFRHTGEDIYLMNRVLHEGYKNYFCAESKLIHYAGRSSKQDVARVQVDTYLSTTHYLNLGAGYFKAILYRVFIYIIDVPLKGMAALSKLLLFREGSKKEFYNFLQICKGVTLWRPLR